MPRGGMLSERWANVRDLPLHIGWSGDFPGPVEKENPSFPWVCKKALWAVEGHLAESLERRERERERRVEKVRQWEREQGRLRERKLVTSWKPMEPGLPTSWAFSFRKANTWPFLVKPVCIGFQLSIKKKENWGAWVPQLVKHLTLAFSSGHDLSVSWVWAPSWALCWQPRACLGFSLSLPLSLPLPHSRRLCLSQINK